MQHANLRIQKELAEIKAESDSGITADLVEDNLHHWKGTLFGPEDTPYHGGVFIVDIRIPSNYPFVPPEMRFDTKIWHPNVSSANGAICLDILKDQWSPALTMRTALLSLLSLLNDPNADDPQDAQVASQYKKDKSAFDQTARYWTETFAKPPTDNSAKVDSLVAMGFEKAQAEAALEATNWDESAAIERLLGGA